MAVHCLGGFDVYQDDRVLGHWPNRRPKAIFQYLVAHRPRPVPKEVLMDLFWPHSGAGAARNNLNVAVYALRRRLRRHAADFSHVLFQDECYLLNPGLDLWVDMEEFDRLVASDSMADLQAAEALYEGDLFADDPYEDWMMPRRRELQDAFLGVLDRLRDRYLALGDLPSAGEVCKKMLAVDSCREDVHRELMRYYVRQGHHHLALRQYHACQSALREELNTGPSEETAQLHEQIRRRDAL